MLCPIGPGASPPSSPPACRAQGKGVCVHVAVLGGGCYAHVHVLCCGCRAVCCTHMRVCWDVCTRVLWVRACRVACVVRVCTPSLTGLPRPGFYSAC